jgi:uncharacterized membrane protein required for colicin V production
MMRGNLLDLALLAVMTLGGYAGLKAGAPRKTMTFIATIVAIGLSMRLMPHLGGAIVHAGLFRSPWSYLISFLVVLAILVSGAWFLTIRFGPKPSTGATMKGIGALLGVVEAVILLSSFLLVLKFLDAPARSARSGSLLYRPMVNAAPWSFDALQSVLPEQVHEEDSRSGDHAEP